TLRPRLVRTRVGKASIRTYWDAQSAQSSFLKVASVAGYRCEKIRMRRVDGEAWRIAWYTLPPSGRPHSREKTTRIELARCPPFGALCGFCGARCGWQPLRKRTMSMHVRVPHGTAQLVCNGFYLRGRGRASRDMKECVEWNHRRPRRIPTAGPPAGGVQVPDGADHEALKMPPRNTSPNLANRYRTPRPKGSGAARNGTEDVAIKIQRLLHASQNSNSKGTYLRTYYLKWVDEWSANRHRTDDFMACDHPTIGPRAPGRTTNNNSISDRGANDHEVTDGKFDNCRANDHREETLTTPESVSTTPEMSTPQDTSVTTSVVLFRPGPSLDEEEHTTQADTVPEPAVGQTTTAGALDFLTTVGHSASRSPKQLTHPFTFSPDQTTEAVTTAAVTDVVSDAAFTTVTPLDAITISESGEQETTTRGDLFTSLFPEVSTRVRAAMTTEATTNTEQVVVVSDNSIETETVATITGRVSCSIESRNLTVPCLLPQELNNTVTVKFSEWDHGRTESFREEAKRRLADYCLRKGIPLGDTTIVFVANEHGMDHISFFVMNHTR
ncbi:hypothetical protein HPB47_009075, partial [Ixodes persulcatus]